MCELAALGIVQYINEGRVLDKFYSVYSDYRRRDVPVGLQFSFVIHEADQEMCTAFSPVGVQQLICSKDGLCLVKKRICTLMPIHKMLYLLRKLAGQQLCWLWFKLKNKKSTKDDIDGGNEYKILLFCPEVCWLSRKTCLGSNFEMRGNIKILFCDSANNSLDHFCDFTLFAQVAYLSNKFSIRSGPNLFFFNVETNI